ncbi:IS3 family transposase, partial [Escherichia coli]|nr:IS3 family transposase [Escherichia coli]
DEIDHTALLNEVKEIRREMPRLGARKLQHLLSERGHYMGRDKLFDVLRDSGLLVKRTRSRAITTNSRHWMKKWPNLVRDIIPCR